MKEMQRGPIPAGLKMANQGHQTFLDNTCVLQSPVCLVCCCPRNFLNLINLKFRVRALNGCCILKFRLTKVFGMQLPLHS